MAVIINRNEYSTDNKNRYVTLLTTVFYASLNSCFVEECMGDITKELCNDGEEDCLYYETSTEQGHKWEVTGYVVNKLLEKIKNSNNDLINEEWKEDCINSKGEPFDMEGQTYSVVVF